MGKRKGVRIAGFIVALCASGGLIAAATQSTGAYSTSTSNGTLSGSTGHLALSTTDTELDRLDRVLEARPSQSSEAFDLAQTLEPVLVAHRLAGGTVTAELESITSALGQPMETARAVANVLANVRAHAPGSSARVRSVVFGDRVEVLIEDDGPGIRPALHAQVLVPGVRNAAASVPGSGLGLATAAAAMARQGGSLGLTDRPEGGTGVVLTLPVRRMAAGVPAATDRVDTGPSAVPPADRLVGVGG